MHPKIWIQIRSDIMLSPIWVQTTMVISRLMGKEWNAITSDQAKIWLFVYLFSWFWIEQNSHKIWNPNVNLIYGVNSFLATGHSVICWYHLQTVWTQIRTSDLIWIFCMTTWWYSWKNFWKKLILKKICWNWQKHEKLPRACKELVIF